MYKNPFGPKALLDVEIWKNNPDDWEKAHGLNPNDASDGAKDADGDGYPENVASNGRGSVRIALGFRTGSHVSTTLPVMAQGPGALMFTGVYDQTDIPLKIAAALASNTSDIDRALDKLVYSSEFPRTPGK